ncbi:hypothetical protein BO86DRAFT_395213 [Aspergillus japonicus CBS 114.51]|uniref:SNARE-complex protein Syntaxin-18 N-terminal domain-containing protein n=1 Tax=Aspergillus japonicus CBS 114.51 TaxID=1448312 RepID=A0A8T8XET3_ASPJA|nr:hypothetical protein BO86DRAFT_395213 [Aspergillus japonicus CBS 114.51]RAH86590.1 hypothetical protein BO86DRAFT_395213 [Aspergillus japonicus CBS 114.51]
MTDLTPTLRELLKSKPNAPRLSNGHHHLSTETADEFLKEAYRINNHITSLLHYLHRIRPSYLSITNHNHNHNTNKPKQTSPSTPSPTGNLPTHPTKDLTDTDRTEIDTSTSHLLRQLSTSISTLASAETLRHETRAQLLRKKYGSRMGILGRWAAGGDAPGVHAATPEQRAEEAAEENTKQLRAAVLWFLQRKLEAVVAVQRGMVEKRLERVRERERSVLYLSQQQQLQQQQQQQQVGKEEGVRGEQRGLGHGEMMLPPGETQGQRLEETELHAIEAQLSPEQLLLFAEENDAMVKYYEDTLSKVRYVVFPLPFALVELLAGGICVEWKAELMCVIVGVCRRTAEKSLLEISSLQQTLVAHLSTQEEYIGQLVTDASNTHSNIGQGNKELKRASERRSTAQAVFWGTVGLCTWLVVWDLVF